jgi:predicted aldo/keto reductase-like oxidoreductase
MLYRQLGRTGLKVSQLGFGAMRLPMVGEGEAAKVDRDLAVPMILRAFEGGVNYIDTAVGYCNRDSQCAVGDALKAWGKRDQIVLSAKNHAGGGDEKAWWQNLEDSLSRLQVDHIDIYNLHGINWKQYGEDIAAHRIPWMVKAKDQGLIRHICFSFHDNNEALIKLIDTGHFDVVTLQYNMLDRSLEKGIAHARAQGLGVVVMGPVGGGRLGATSEVFAEMVPGVKRVPELAMRFVLANPDVTVALSGMSTMAQVEENLAACSDPISLSDADHQAIEEHLDKLKAMADLYCTGCRYCMPCSHEVKIADIFAQYNVARVYGLWDVARDRYANLVKKGVAVDACIECGECEPKCPQNIAIVDQLKQAEQALLGPKA